MKLKENEIILTYYPNTMISDDRYLVDIIDDVQLLEFVDVLRNDFWGGDIDPKHINQALEHITVSINEKELNIYEKWKLKKEIKHHVEEILK